MLQPESRKIQLQLMVRMKLKEIKKYNGKKIKKIHLNESYGAEKQTTGNTCRD